MTAFAAPLVEMRETVNWLWISLGTAMHIFAFSLVATHCLRNRREVASTLLWIFASWSFPLVGPLAYLCFGVNRVPDKAWHTHRSNQKFLTARRDREDAAMPLAYWRAVRELPAVEPVSVHTRELNNVMDAVLADYPLLGGNGIEPLVTGDEAYPAMLKAIEGATHHIHLQTFIFGNDRTGRQFRDLLRHKAESGVTVRLLYDRFGSTSAFLSGMLNNSRKTPGMHLAGWTQANPIKRQFQINLRNHRKILIVDGKAAFTGGINLHDENMTRNGEPPIRDYHFALRGPIVQELQYSFLRDWYFITDEAPEILLTNEHFPHIEPAGTAMIRVLDGGPASELDIITDIFFGAITAARKQLLVVTPYLVPPADIMRALRSAALRRVDVRLVVPLKNNHWATGYASRALYDELLAAGVRIFERRPPFLHAKAMIVDDELAIVGSANLDVRSLKLNYEANLAVYDEAFINKLKEMILEDISASEEVNLTVWRARPLRRQLMENFCNLLTPVL